MSNVDLLASHVQAFCMLNVDEVFSALTDLDFTLTDYGTETTFNRTIHNRYAYRPGRFADSPLIVVHADTVLKRCAFSYNSSSGVVVSSELDDRLGLACITFAEDIGLGLAECAVLVCDNEEIGHSTARIFANDTVKNEVQPNWLVELDRRGTDVVCYDYENDTLSSLLGHVGFKIGNGTFSDICCMKALQRSGFNVGIGYHREHTTECHANLHDTLKQLRRLEKFYNTFRRVKLRYEQTIQPVRHVTRSNVRSYVNYKPTIQLPYDYGLEYCECCGFEDKLRSVSTGGDTIRLCSYCERKTT